MPISLNERLSPSWPRMKVATRVESVWKARSMMSYISSTYSTWWAGMPAGRGLVGIDVGPELLRLLDPLLDVADSGQVLVQLLLVPAGEAALHGAGVGHHEVEHAAPVHHLALGIAGALAVRAGAEEALEGEAGVGLRGHRGRRGLPGDVVLVGARVARVAVGGLPARVAAQLDRGEAGQVADVVRDHLVDGDAGADVGGALVEAHAGEEHAVAARMVAAAVVARSWR